MKSFKGKSLIKVLTITLFVAFMFMKLVDAQSEEEDADDEGEGGEEEPEKTCKKVIFDLVRGFVSGALKCLGGQVPGFRLRTPFELLTRFYCIVKCVLGSLGMLNEEGKLDEVAALFYFQEAIPASIIDSVIAVAQPCLEMASQFRPEQYYCQSYSPFVQCVFTSLIGALAPYVVDCFATPGLGAFFSFLQFVVPRAMEGPAAEARKRLTEATNSTLRFRKGANSTLQASSSSESWIDYAISAMFNGV